MNKELQKITYDFFIIYGFGQTDVNLLDTIFARIMTAEAGVFALPLVPRFTPDPRECVDARDIVRNYFDRHQGSGAVVVKLSGVYLDLLHPCAVPEGQKVNMWETTRKLDRNGNLDVSKLIVGQPVSVPEAVRQLQQAETMLNRNDIAIENDYWSSGGSALYATAIQNVSFLKPTEKCPLYQVTRKFEEALGEPYPGMTTPEYYLGSGGSSTNWHIDDAMLGTYHLHIMGGPKRFYLVDPAQTDQMAEFMKRMTSGRCARRWAHYGIGISPAMLVRNGFRVFTALLNPSDVIMMQPGTWHSVLNMNGLSLAGAVAIPSPSWLENYNRLQPHGCSCGYSKDPIQLPENVTTPGNFTTWDECLTGGVPLVHLCHELGCGFFSKLKTNVDQHIRQVHTEWEFDCDTCHRKFGKKDHLTRHARIHPT